MPTWAVGDCVGLVGRPLDDRLADSEAAFLATGPSPSTCAATDVDGMLQGRAGPVDPSKVESQSIVLRMSRQWSAADSMSIHRPAEPCRESRGVALRWPV